MKMWINWFGGKGVARYAPTVMLLLAACAPVVVAPTETATVEPEMTVTEIASPEETATLELTETQLPTQAVTSTWLPFPTETPFPVATPSDFFVRFWDFSPNGEWVAWITQFYAAEESGPLVLVEQMDKSNRWELFLDIENYRYSEAEIDTLHWSVDGKYLYYGVYSRNDGAFGKAYTSLYRLDLRTGEIAVIIPEAVPDVYAMGIAPNHELLAYFSIREEQPPIYVRNLETGAERSFSLDEYPTEDPIIEEIYWSPTGDSFIFSLFYFADNNFYKDIVIVDAESLAHRILIRVEDGIAVQIWDWDLDYGIMVYVADPNFECNIWFLNGESGELSHPNSACENKPHISYPDATPQP